MVVGFHEKFEEKAEYNQYWYSEKTIEVIVEEIRGLGAERVAFLSTPSVFFSARSAGINGDLFELDPKLDNGDGKFVLYDFNKPEIDENMNGMYDLVVIDPPFITREVLAAYAFTSSQLLGDSEGKVIISSILENKDVLRELFGSNIMSARFKPSIPTLVYQYCLFTNYILDGESGLNSGNTEVAEQM